MPGCRGSGSVADAEVVDISPRVMVVLATRLKRDGSDRAYGGGGCLVTLRGPVLMMLDTSVTNVSMATVAKDLDTTITLYRSW